MGVAQSRVRGLFGLSDVYVSIRRPGEMLLAKDSKRSRGLQDSRPQRRKINLPKGAVGGVGTTEHTLTFLVTCWVARFFVRIFEKEKKILKGLERQEKKRRKIDPRAREREGGRGISVN